ncbi:MAG: acyltransferase [Victivallales bacterium]|nr:acyltransferase [Victivallales bacterium]
MSIPISKSLSLKIKGLSFFNALLVVLLHAYTGNSPESSDSTALIIEKFFSIGLCGVGVPYFFVVSGYFLAHQYDNQVPYSQLVKKRLSSLMKPYCYWCIIYTLTYIAFTIYGNHLAGRPLHDNTCLVLPLTSWQNPFRIFGFDMFLFPADGPLWYVRNLMLLVLISPFLFAILKRKLTSVLFLVIALFFYLSHFMIQRPLWQFFQTGFSFKGLLFFSLGIYLKRYPIQVTDNHKKTVWLSAILCLLWFALAWPYSLFGKEISFIMLHLSFIVGCAALWCLYDLFPMRDKMESMRVLGYSFFIFASHYAILNMLFCQKACNLLKRYLLDNDFLIYVLRFSVTSAISISFAFVLDRYLPKLYKALTGNR